MAEPSYSQTESAAYGGPPLGPFGGLTGFAPDIVPGGAVPPAVLAVPAAAAPPVVGVAALAGTTPVLSSFEPQPLSANTKPATKQQMRAND